MGRKPWSKGPIAQQWEDLNFNPSSLYNSLVVSPWATPLNFSGYTGLSSIKWEHINIIFKVPYNFILYYFSNDIFVGSSCVVLNDFWEDLIFEELQVFWLHNYLRTLFWQDQKMALPILGKEKLISEVQDNLVLLLGPSIPGTGLIRVTPTWL
jgi:hypothetical protein